MLIDRFAPAASAVNQLHCVYEMRTALKETAAPREGGTAVLFRVRSQGGETFRAIRGILPRILRGDIWEESDATTVQRLGFLEGGASG